MNTPNPNPSPELKSEHFICVTCDELFEPSELTKQGQCAGCVRHMPLEDNSDEL